MRLYKGQPETWTAPTQMCDSSVGDGVCSTETSWTQTDDGVKNCMSDDKWVHIQVDSLAKV